jgi:molybdopterin molybdotransferase
MFYYSPMINVEQAEKIILKTTPTMSIESIPLEKAYGRILAQKVLASRDQPPFNRVAMDGIAINSQTNLEQLKIEAIQGAGEKQLKLSHKDHCIEVMTGASLPKSTDCVIPYENIQIKDGQATISKADKSKMKNIHAMAKDYKEGNELLRPGVKITSAVCAIIASQGKKLIDVFNVPKVTIISTGTELVDLNNPILDHQIFMSNSYAIENELRSFGLNDVKRVHIVDDKKVTQKVIEESLNTSDILILTGGVSKGKYDYIPECLENLGVIKQFHKIEQKPGKPMFYGLKENKQIFALPGNPVSCLVCLRRYVTPSIYKSLSFEGIKVFGELQEKVNFKKAFTFFVAVKCTYSNEGKLLLSPISTNGSGDFNSLGQSEGFIQLPANKQEFLPGESYEFFRWNT